MPFLPWWEGNHTGGSRAVISRAKGGDIGTGSDWFCRARTVTTLQAGPRAVELG